MPQTEQIPTQTDPPKKRKLYDALSKDGYYTKSYEDFDKQFSTAESVYKLGTTLKAAGYYSKGMEQFHDQFFQEVPKQISQPEVTKMPAQQAATNWSGAPFPTVQTSAEQFMEMAATPMVSRKDKAIQKIEEVIERDGDNVIRDYLMEEAEKAKANDPSRLASESTAINNYVPPALIKKEKEKEKASIPQEVVDEYKSDPERLRFVLRKTAASLKGAGKEEEANQVRASAYILDADQRVNSKNADKIEKNISAIEKGEITYDIETGQLIKPLGLGEGIKYAYKNRTKDYGEFYDMAKMSEEEEIKHLNKKISSFDPDDPVPTPGTIASLIGSEGVSTGKSIAAGAITAWLSRSPVLINTAAAAASADEIYARSYVNEKTRVYAQMKDKYRKENPELPDAEIDKMALKTADQTALALASSDLAANALATYTGMKLARTPIQFTPSKGVIKAAEKVLGTTIKSVKQALPESLAVGGITAGIQIGKNEIANQFGAKRDADEGVLGAGMMGAALPLVMTSVIHATGATKNTILHAFRKTPTEVVAKTAVDLVEDGALTPEQGEQIVSEIQQFKDKDAQVPEGIVDETARMEAHDLMDEYNANKQKLAKPEEGGLHESAHKPIKERQKEIEWEMNLRQQSPEDQITLLKSKQQDLQSQIDEHDAAKAEGKAGKLEDRGAIKKQVTALTKRLEDIQAKVDDPIYKAQKIVEKGNIKGFSKDIIEDAAKNDPEAFKTYLQNIAEQAQDPLSRETTIDTYGKELVKIADEMFPAPKPPAVIMPEQNKGVSETITIGSKTPPASKVKFKTAKGSEYEVNEDGGTTRNKAAREDVGHEGDEGVKEASKKTWYLTEEQMNTLSEITTKGTAKKEIAQMPDGSIGVRYVDGPNKGKFERRTVVKPANDPELGLHPLEIWDDGYHFGNKITEIIKPESDAIRIQETDAMDVRQQAGDGEEMGGRNTESQEPTGARTQEEGQNQGQEEIGGVPPATADPTAVEGSGESNTTNIKHATLRNDAEAKGLGELADKTGRTFEDINEKADALIKAGKTQDIIDKVKKGQAINADEKGVLVKTKAAIDAEYDAAISEYDAAVLSGDQAAIDAADIKKNQLANQSYDIYNTAKKAGSEAGLNLVSQKLESSADYSIGEMLTRRKNAKGDKWKKEDQTQVEEQNKKIKEKEQKIKDKAKEIADKIRNLRINKGGGDKAMSNLFSIPVAIYDGAVVTIANIVEQGGNLIDAVNEGVKYIKANGGLKDKADEANFRKHILNAGNEQKRLDMMKSRTKTATAKLRGKIQEGDFSKPDKTPIELDREAQDLRAELEDVKHEFELAVVTDELKKRSTWQKGINIGRRLIGTTRAITSGIDASAIGVQNYFAILANLRSGKKALVEHVKDAVSEKRFRRNMAELKNSPYWNLMQESGLEILEPQSLAATKVEEVMADSYHNSKIMVNGKNVNPFQALKPFERAFTSLGNNLRTDLFIRRVNQITDNGTNGKTFKTHPEEFKGAARVINEMTGRGKLNEHIQTASPIITPIIWSPRLIASGLNLLGISDMTLPFVGRKGYYASLTPAQRKYAISQVAKGIGMAAGIMAAFKLSNALGADTDVDVDPWSVTFGNARVGNKSYNVFGRFSPYVKLVFQFLWAERHKEGKVQDLDGKGYNTPTQMGLVGRFGRGKMTPFAGGAYDFIQGKDFYTQEKYTWKEFAKDQITPMSLQEVKQGLQRDGSISLINDFLPSFVGISVSDRRDFVNKKSGSGKPERPKRPTKPSKPD